MILARGLYCANEKKAGWGGRDGSLENCMAWALSWLLLGEASGETLLPDYPVVGCIDPNTLIRVIRCDRMYISMEGAIGAHTSTYLYWCNWVGIQSMSV